ncbi:MAG: hypothetical protein ACXWV0_08935 [Flavisolibacter sp.]
MDAALPLPGMDGEGIFADLRLENEILKLKMQAEHGASIFSHEDLPPEMEAMFLKQVQDFESARRFANQISIHTLIGSPSFQPCQELDEEEILHSTNKLLEHLAAKNIKIEKPDAVEAATFYRFLTEELMNEETEDIQLDGMIKFYDYHMFHPDHQVDIRITADRFLDNWFRKNIEGLKWEMSRGIILPDSSILSPDETIEKVQLHFEKFPMFTGGDSRISDVGFQWSSENNTGIGHAEGELYYDAETDNGKLHRVVGPFKIYFVNEMGFWSVFYFVMPGFNWEKEI